MDKIVVEVCLDNEVVKTKEFDEESEGEMYKYIAQFMDSRYCVHVYYGAAYAEHLKGNSM